MGGLHLRCGPGSEACKAANTLPTGLCSHSYGFINATGGIALDAPQMKNAISGIESAPWLRAVLQIFPAPRRFAVFADLSLVYQKESDSERTSTERSILSIGLDAAVELYQQIAQSRQQIKDAEILSKVDLSEIRIISDRTDRPRPSNDYLMRYIGRDVGRETRLLLESTVSSAKSIEEVQRDVRALAARMRDDANLAYREPLKNKIGTFAGEEVSVPGYVRNLLGEISHIKVLHLRERRKAIGREEAKRLLDLKVRRGGTEALRSIQETVATLLGVRIDAFQGDPMSQVRSPEAELDVDDFLVQVNGSGIREALRLILDFEFEQPRVLLVEEPEVHLHPALETGMMRYLKRISSECQIILTTHSTNFLDTADMKNVYLVSKDNSTQVRLLDIGDIETEIPRELGLRLSSFFMFDRLIFVEGPSDEDLIREWASVLGVNLSQANVGFVHMGGVRNLGHFAAEATLSLLTRRQVKIWFLIDRDEKEQDEIVKLQERLGAGAAIKVLSKRELENYLIKARPIAELIKIKSPNTPVSEDGLKAVIEQCADSIKQTALDKKVVKVLCTPVYPERKRIFAEGKIPIADRISSEIDKMIDSLKAVRQSIGPTIEEQDALLGKNWDRDKLNIVPGDMLLDTVFRHFSLRFHKGRDGARLAALMHENEIDPEIKSFIREIVR